MNATETKPTCDVCGRPGAKRQICHADGKCHHHGKVHTALRGSMNDLAALCDECHKADSYAWEKIWVASHEAATATETKHSPPHSYVSGYGQCMCRWCGRPRTVAYMPCRVTTEMRRWLAVYAQAHGRTWKSRLRALWDSGEDEGIGRELRNIIGPRGLDRITPRMMAQIAHLANAAEVEE